MKHGRRASAGIPHNLELIQNRRREHVDLGQGIIIGGRNAQAGTFASSRMISTQSAMHSSQIKQTGPAGAMFDISLRTSCWLLLQKEQ
jgi:hypothetical protein